MLVEDGEVDSSSGCEMCGVQAGWAAADDGQI
jgi:hypothetical protein